MLDDDEFLDGVYSKVDNYRTNSVPGKVKIHWIRYASVAAAVIVTVTSIALNAGNEADINMKRNNGPDTAFTIFDDTTIKLAGIITDIEILDEGQLITIKTDAGRTMELLNYERNYEVVAGDRVNVVAIQENHKLIIDNIVRQEK